MPAVIWDWWSAGKAIQVNDVAVSLWGVSGNTVLGNNSYYNSTDKYATTSGASQYAQFNGEHIWYTAPSGTADDTITFTQAMTLDASGNFLVGTTATVSGCLGSFFKASGSILGTESTDTGATNHLVFKNPNGVVGTIQVTGSATAYVTSSDYRLKENVAPMTGALAKVLELNPVTALEARIAALETGV
jgi:hypothetical protein